MLGDPKNGNGADAAKSAADTGAAVGDREPGGVENPAVGGRGDFSDDIPF